MAGVVSTSSQQEDGGFKEPEPCKICGDKSSGNHYGIVSCEGCKGFFRRSVQNKKDLRCAKEGKCKITVKTRNDCPACRLQRCIDCGMDKSLVQRDKCKKRKSNDDGIGAPETKRLCESLLDDDDKLESVNDISRDILDLCNSSSSVSISANEFAAVANAFSRILSGLQKTATVKIQDCEIDDVIEFLRQMVVNFENAFGNKINKDYPLFFVLATLYLWSKRDGMTPEEATKMRIIAGELTASVKRNEEIRREEANQNDMGVAYRNL